MGNFEHDFFKALEEYIREETKQQYEDYWTNYSPNIGNGLLDIESMEIDKKINELLK